MNKRIVLVVLAVSLLVIMACSLVSAPGSDSIAQDETGEPVSPGTEPSLESPVVDEDVFPLTPDPINVTATLDTEHAATYQKGNFTQSVNTEGADGTLFDLSLRNDTLLMEDAEGDLAIDYDSDLTMTPVSSIEGLPFSQGYLAAVHFGPDGAKLVQRAILSMEIIGEYDPNELIGFAADGTGEDLHLYPATFYSFDGKTYAEFYITHFSLYGVAPVLLSEIEAQQAHPPVNPASQDDQELAPMVRIEPTDDELAPISSPEKLALEKSYNRLVKKKIENLEKTSCKRVSTVVQEYNDWVSKVEKAEKTEAFKNQIERDRFAMLDRLIDCIRPTCETCLNPQTGVKPNKTNVDRTLIMIEFARELSISLQLGDEKITNLWLLANECSKTIGRPLSEAGIAADGGRFGAESHLSVVAPRDGICDPYLVCRQGVRVFQSDSHLKGDCHFIIICNTQNATMPMTMVSTVFFVRQATKMASTPASRRGLVSETSSVPVCMTSSGTTMAVRMATGTKRSALRKSGGASHRPLNAMNESRVRKVSAPMTTMTIQMLISIFARSTTRR